MGRAESPVAGDFPEVEDLMPHRAPVLLLDRVSRHDASSTEAIARIDTQSWLTLDDGSVRSWLAVEYMAQCVAAHEGLLALDEGRPPPSGFLVSVNGLKLESARFEADAVLRVSARRSRGRPELGALSHECTLGVEAPGGGEIAMLAVGRLSVSVPRGASVR